MPDTIAKNSDTKPIGPDLGDKPWYEGMTSGIDKIANTSERQREQPAPGVFDFTPVAAFKTFTSHVRMRVIGFILTAPAAEVINIQIGTTLYRFYVAAGNSPALTLFPITIDRGTDITVLNATADHFTWAFQLFYYPE